MNGEPLADPVLFLKPSTSVTGPGDAIKYRCKSTERVDFEGELAVVIGRLCREVPRERAEEVIFGYTCANDVTARDLQARDGRGLGPRASTRSARWGRGWRPGPTRPTSTGHHRERAVRQQARTSEMLWTCPR